MDWKKFLAPVLFNSALVFALFMSDLGDGNVHQYGTHQFAFALFLVIGGSIGMVGFEELKRGGHRKVKRNLLICLAVLFILFLFLAFTGFELHWKVREMDSVYLCLLIPFYILLVASFPIALYLNRNQNRSTSQQESANES
ncbi:MAG: hypothetical protein ABSF70_06545 [Terracidiphilus sp.]|jgi:uncharacterized membrane protein YozB (DUF420 family)